MENGYRAQMLPPRRARRSFEAFGQPSATEVEPESPPDCFIVTLTYYRR